MRLIQVGEGGVMEGERGREKNRCLAPSPPGRTFPFLSPKMINFETCCYSTVVYMCVCMPTCLFVSACACTHRMVLIGSF